MSRIVKHFDDTVYYAVIMAGGTGTRLWPLSRQNRPKQALNLIGERSMLQHAIDRTIPVFGPDRIIVVTRSEHLETLQAQAPELPPENFIVEPEGRGTAPAIALAAIHLHKRDPDAIMAVLTADHYIADVGRFQSALIAARAIAEDNRLVTLGIKPSSASTGFGYIKQGKSLGVADGFPVFSVEKFIEKPDLPAAIQMTESGLYSWNSGMFFWRVDRILKEFERQMPDFFAQLKQIETVLGAPDYEQKLTHIWPRVAKQTIDYGVMENAENVAVIPVDIGWVDVGNWSSLFGTLSRDKNGNAAVGPHATIDIHNTLLFGEKRLIAAIGVKDLVIVDTADALLICPLDREQEVRDMVKLLGETGLREWL
jgi:mannose-1-phosphate guanylyltransferase